MSKNILVFSDGTGQVGGLRPDQHLSNVYKLYRASRTGPDSPIDPAQQIAFYDAGLGSEQVEGPFWQQFRDSIRKFLSAAFGTGLTVNVADCYAAILSVYETGDRVWLFGFSRGAYTVRSVAGVMNLCGLPAQDADGQPIPRWGSRLRSIAEEAVHSVYEHGAGRPRKAFEDQREEKARRFRVKYGTQDGPKNERGDVAPYFIGVFDTVAALGSSGFKKFLMIALTIAVILAGILGTAWLANWIFNWSLWETAPWLTAAFLSWLLIYDLRHRVKIITHYPKKWRFRIHRSGWRFKHYDRFLDPRVRYARHALAIDESRATFARVEWGRKIDQTSKPADWLVQMWFAGNHSDIGGSYAETESRLSDIALEWMVGQASEVPHPLIVDKSKLHLFPDPLGMQHCEIVGLREMYPRWIPRALRRSWKQLHRAEIQRPGNEFRFHPSVSKRFEAEGVLKCGVRGKYRPPNLEKSEQFYQYYPQPEPNTDTNEILNKTPGGE